jgi:hypothetical protein
MVLTMFPEHATLLLNLYPFSFDYGIQFQQVIFKCVKSFKFEDAYEPPPILGTSTEVVIFRPGTVILSVPFAEMFVGFCEISLETFVT